ncbi:MAG: hypothetical protein GC190_11645 [Alphaproteobacteria bacterium]|nr:hypothetical protein [Alphaproteobacteria bacterium]
MLRLSSYLSLACAVLLASTVAARAEDEKWTVSEVAGATSVVSPLAPTHAVSKGEELQPGATLTTGAGGKVVLTDGKTVVTMSPNSRLTMPADPSDAMTRFAEDLGSVFFKVEKRPMQHFEVQTPMIAAIVKGTQFTVTAGSTEHAVDVTEGLVEVVAMHGGQKELVPAGRSAKVRSDAPTKLNLAGDPPGTGKVERAIGAGTIDYASVTDGLVTATTALTTVTSSADGKSEGGSNEEAASGATGGTVALIDGATSSAGGLVADVASSVGDASNGGSLGAGANTGAGAGSGSGVGVGVEVGASAGGAGAGAGVSVGVGAGSGGVGVGIGVGITGGTAAGASGGSGGSGGIGLGVGLTGGTPPGQGKSSGSGGGG